MAFQTLIFSGKLTSSRENTAINSGISEITTLKDASNGQSIEDIESIKKYATRIYSLRKVTVTTNDYEAIIPSLYPQTDSVSAFGGETLDPPQYGKVL